MKIWKVADRDCPICTKMSEFDTSVIQSMGLEFEIIMFDRFLQYPDLAEWTKANLVVDGMIDIPLYILELDGEFVGAVTGEHTKSEFKRRIYMAAG